MSARFQLWRSDETMQSPTELPKVTDFARHRCAISRRRPRRCLHGQTTTIVGEKSQVQVVMRPRASVYVSRAPYNIANAAALGLPRRPSTSNSLMCWSLYE